MKRLHRFTALLLVLVTLAALLPTGAMASVKVNTLKFGKWYTSQQPGGDTWTAYRLKVSKETVVYVTWKSADTSSTFSEVDFASDQEVSNLVAAVFPANSKSGRDAVVLYPGTWYVAILDTSDGVKVKFTAKAASKFKGGNTSAKKATALKAGVTAEAIADRKNKKPRWYKAKLSKKQKLQLFGTVYDCVIYDSSMKKVPTSYFYKDGVEGLRSKKALPKGAYYIKATWDYIPEETGVYKSFYWK